MPLPFNNQHRGVRQFQCFVCGLLFETRPEFSNHVKETHEEGREWVKCPLERCQAPVRDVRAHFRNCHKHDVVPKNCQMRCVVWNDPKNPKLRKKKVAFQEGYFSSAKNRRSMHYNSSWEREVYEVLEKRPDVVKYEVEPLAIEYYFQGETKNYLPDLRVHFSGNYKEIWEIKPISQTGMAVNKAKWESCAEYCKKRGWDFKVITEVGIAKMKNDLRLSNKEEDDDEDYEVE
jgi:hypothetical protein